MSGIPFLFSNDVLIDPGFCERGDFGETARVAHRQIRKHLTVDFHGGGFKAENQLAVRQAVDSCRGIDPGNPQARKSLFLTLRSRKA